jgi:hypothetical protein
VVRIRAKKGSVTVNRGDIVFVTWYDMNAKGIYLEWSGSFHTVLLIEDAVANDGGEFPIGHTLFLRRDEFQTIEEKS